MLINYIYFLNILHIKGTTEISNTNKIETNKNFLKLLKKNKDKLKINYTPYAIHLTEEFLKDNTKNFHISLKKISKISDCLTSLMAFEDETKDKNNKSINNENFKYTLNDFNSFNMEIGNKKK